MADSATLTVTLAPEIAGRLAEIAAREHSTPGAVAAEAVADFVVREAAALAAIARGRADVEAGRIFPQAEVTRDVQAIIDGLRARA